MKGGTVPECRAMCNMDGELLGTAVKCPGAGFCGRELRRMRDAVVCRRLTL